MKCVQEKVQTGLPTVTRGKKMITTMTKKSAKKDPHKPHRLIRIPPELYEQLRQEAEESKRPVSWEIRLILEECVNRRRKAREERAAQQDT